MISKGIILSIVSVLLFSALTFAQSASKKAEPLPPIPVPQTVPKLIPKAVAPEYKTATEIGMTLSWKVDSAGMLHCKMSAPTTGWLAIGFDVTGKVMKDGNIIMGYVKDGTAFVSDQYGTGWVKHQADTEIGGKNNVTDISGTEKNGTTEISFTIPLDSKDKFDKALSVGKEYTVMFAFAANGAKDFTSKHTNTKKFNIKF